MALALVAVGAACGSRSGEGGRLEASWTGADTGRLSVPARADWCANDTLLQIIGEAGDSGLAIAVLPADSLAPGVYPVGVPTPRRTRPGARAGIRWFGETLIEGYHTLSGVVRVDSGRTLNGTIEATLKNVNDGAQLTLTGAFHNLVIEPGSPGRCGGGSPLRPDTSVR